MSYWKVKLCEELLCFIVVNYEKVCISVIFEDHHVHVMFDQYRPVGFNALQHFPCCAL